MAGSSGCATRRGRTGGTMDARFRGHDGFRCNRSFLHPIALPRRSGESGEWDHARPRMTASRQSGLVGCRLRAIGCRSKDDRSGSTSELRFNRWLGGSPDGLAASGFPTGVTHCGRFFEPRPCSIWVYSPKSPICDFNFPRNNPMNAFFHGKHGQAT